MNASEALKATEAAADGNTGLGARIRARRKAIGKTMQQVADEASLTIGFISQIPMFPGILGMERRTRLQPVGSQASRTRRSN